tara:strand:+ start:1443 stop:1721 length:279 start_codon:yes stop_codon:yes gene_type:complete
MENNMKKTLIIGLFLMFISCRDMETKRYYIEYEIHYPDRTDTLSAVNDFYHTPSVNSSRGSNSIYYAPKNGGYANTIIETSAPLNIITIKEQ